MKTIMTYLILVGLPVLGVLLVLRLGQNLRPPVSVGGAWVIESPAQTFQATGCNTEMEQLTLSIWQSGPHLVLTLDTNPSVNLTGVITDLSLMANAHNQTASVQVTHLEATVDRQSEPDQLSGSLTLNGCSTAVPFTAVRQPISVGASNH